MLRPPHGQAPTAGLGQKYKNAGGKEMMSSDIVNYPPTQTEAGRYSKLYQNSHYGLVAVNLSLLVASAGIDLLNLEAIEYPKTLLLILSLILSFTIKKLRLDQKWYASRSLSESIKTLTWRYTMAVHPFEAANSHAQELFVARIQEACEQTNKIIGFQKFTFDTSQLPPQTSSLSSNLQNRISLYARLRLGNQSKWYKIKARKLKNISVAFFSILAFSNVAAITLSILDESGIFIGSIATGLFASLTTALIGWIEARRYGELSAAYSLTYNEIELLTHYLHSISKPSELNDFVGEAESLFSREHTQWAAKRGFIEFAKI
ncbi:hypothetical protein CCL09_11535 [Pseudomonas congelans]|uniref:DUF4231 domain-containing protein n=1 Tax=Pseudomonas congelans TaxID=200452 RepID=UPI000BB6025B|nr:DUF4231 domain-containing protein [Pseudomonas congelans]PBQ17681.1 hypothetical protein CCL09_11535 [Pseudomonas congelans]